jgi:ribonuclease III
VALTSLFKQLAIQPQQLALFEQALTHKSFAREHNERLEYLGDAVLDLVIGEALYHQYPDLREGELSRYRAELVNGSFLADKARKLQLSQYLRLSTGERKAGGANKESILSDALESLFGAMYLDLGYPTTQQVALNLFAKDIAAIANRAQQKDAKTRLQEWAQAKRHSLPSYTLVKSTGKDHQQVFTVRCDIQTLSLFTEETGLSKKAAEQQAAESLLLQLEQRQLL